MAEPLVYIVVLNYRTFEDTIQCIHSLNSIDYPNYRIVVIDNDSPNRSEDLLRESFPQIPVIQAGHNRGYAAGNNIGIRMAVQEGAEFVLVLNNDTVVTREFLSILVAYATTHTRVGVLSPILVDDQGQPNRNCTRRAPSLWELFWNYGIGGLLDEDDKWARRTFYLGEYDFKDPKEVEVISGACMLIRSNLLEQIGLLDEGTFLYWEEFILFEKVRKTEFQTVVVPASRVIHKCQKTIGEETPTVALSHVSSVNHYLKHYRNTGRLIRWIVVSSIGLSLIPGILRRWLRDSLSRTAKITRSDPDQ